METLEQIKAEKSRLEEMEKMLKKDIFMAGYSHLNVQKDSNGKLISFDAYTYGKDSIASELKKFKEDDSILLFFNSLKNTNEFRTAKVRITFLDEV